MRLPAIALLLLLGAAPPPAPAPPPPPPPDGTAADTIDYTGPLGLRWGQSLKEVKTALAGRFQLVREGEPAALAGAAGLQYAGEFAGQRTEALALAFQKGELASVNVIFDRDDPLVGAALFRRLAGEVAAAYGPPAVAARVPAELEKALEPSRLPPSEETTGRWREQLRLALTDGRWAPLSRWRFRNGVEIWLKLALVPGVASAPPLARVTWAFFDPRRAAPPVPAVPARPRDY